MSGIEEQNVNSESSAQSDADTEYIDPTLPESVPLLVRRNAMRGEDLMRMIRQSSIHEE